MNNVLYVFGKKKSLVRKDYCKHGVCCYCNPSLGLMTEVRGCKVVSQEEDPGVTSHALGSAKSARE
jgi:hypothetical protein